MPPKRTCVVAASLSFGVALPAQESVRLNCPGSPFQEPLTEVTSVVELSGGRVLVGDAADGRLVVLGPAPREAREIGRMGSGPREFRSIGVLLPRPDRGAWVNDFALRRLLPVTDGGELEEVVGHPPGVRLIVQGADARGRIYGDVLGTRTGRSVSDSMPIVRWEPGTMRVDTVTTYDAGWSRRVVRGGGPLPAYQAVDAWAVLPTGEVAVLEAATYRVTLWDQGRRVRSNVVEWEPVRVTEAERDAYRSAQGKARGLGQPGASTVPTRREFQFPETLPAFEDDGVRVSPDGHIWVERLRSARDSLRRYDILDARGGLIVQVLMSARTRLAGFGPAAVYTAASNDVDERFISRCAIPEPARRR